MKKELDEQWLFRQATDEESKLAMLNILRQRRYVYEHNRFIGRDELSAINLGGRKIWFRERSAFSSVEVYHEIFRERNHFLLPEFSGCDETVVVDIGANEGYYALKIKELNPACRVICVEPNPYLFDVMRANMESNGLSDVQCVNRAIARNEGTMCLEIVKEIGPIGGRGLKMVDRPWLRDEFISTINVQTTTLDNLFRQFEIDHAGLLKIDVEGMELDVLEGASPCLDSVNKIVIERHSRILRDEIISFLTARGFRLVYDEDPDIRRYYGDLYFLKQVVS